MSDHGAGPGYQPPEDMTLFVLIIPPIMGITLIITVVTAIILY